MSILVKPLVTEKFAKLTERSKEKQYGFVADILANKIQIKQAIEQKYGVTVLTVRTSIIPARKKTRFTKTGVMSGKTSRIKRVYVTLALGQEIDFYGNA